MKIQNLPLTLVAFTKSNIQLFMLVVLLILVLSSGCSKSDRTFSVLAESQTFEQNTKSQNTKIDILWVVDGSGTMVNHQDNLANNFSSFIGSFVNKNYDFHMAVTSVDAWVRERNYNAGGCTGNPNPTNNPNQIYTSSADCNTTLATYAELTHFRDGDIYGAIGGAPGTRSGKYLITNQMSPSEILSTFAINVKTGTRGDGNRESGLASIRSVLRRNDDGSVGYSGETHTELANFRRQDAFLAVIIVTDEEDQSRKQNNTSYANNTEYVNSFVSFMDNYTGSVEGNRKYNISSIAINDINNCAYALHAQATQGDRYMAISQATDGIVGNICDSDFASQLDVISEKIVSLSTRFQLDREPIPSTIRVTVNGVSIPEDATNGWTFINENGFYFVEFHGTSVPQEGAQIGVDFDPVSLQ